MTQNQTTAQPTEPSDVTLLAIWKSTVPDVWRTVPERAILAYARAVREITWRASAAELERTWYMALHMALPIPREHILAFGHAVQMVPSDPTLRGPEASAAQTNHERLETLMTELQELLGRDTDLILKAEDLFERIVETAAESAPAVMIERTHEGGDDWVVINPRTGEIDALDVWDATRRRNQIESEGLVRSDGEDGRLPVVTGVEDYTFHTRYFTTRSDDMVVTLPEGWDSSFDMI